MYIGQFEHTIDIKNRLFLPSKYRQKKGLFVLTRGLELCLSLYDIQSWEKVLVRLESMQLKNKIEERAFKRALLSGAHEVSPDVQGRVLIPQVLMEYARLKNDIAIIGVGDRLELWDAKNWQQYYQKEADTSFKNLAGELDI